MKPSLKLRQAVLWITGHDLLRPKPVLQPGHIVFKPIPLLWYITFTKDEYMKITHPSGPNVLHRFMQRVCFGIRWKMLEIKE
jgi:hypothetical protein